MITLFLVRVICQYEGGLSLGLPFFVKRWGGIGLGLGGCPALIRGPHIGTPAAPDEDPPGEQETAEEPADTQEPEA